MVSLGQPHDVLEAYAVPAPGGVRVEFVRDSDADDIPSDHRNLAFIAAEKLLVRAGRSAVTACDWCCGSTSPPAPGWAEVPPMPRPRCSRCVSCSRSTSTTSACTTWRPRSAPTCRSASLVARPGCGAGARQIEPLAVPHGLAFLFAIPPFRLSTPDVYKAWDRLGGPVSSRSVPAPRRVAPVRARAHERPRARSRSGRAAAGRVPGRAGERRRKPCAARGERIGLRGARRRRPPVARSWSTKSGRRCGCR